MLRFALACLAAAASLFAAAAPEYPARSVKLIVADAPKSAADILARVVAAEIAKAWKKTVVVENRPGGAGRIAAQMVARARPDGYTLLYAPNTTFCVEPWTHPAKAFDALRDLEPVAAVGSAPFFLAVPRDMSVNSFQELLGNARLRAGAMRYGTTGVASMQHIAALSIAQLSGVRWQHVPEKTMAQATKDLSEGKLQLIIGTLPVIQPIADREKAKILAVTSDKRYPALPDVTSVGEALTGWSEVSILHGVFAPRGTPEAVIERINAETERAIHARLALKALFEQGFMPGGGTPADLQARLVREYDNVGRLAKAAGIAPQ
jgi:tripartite-type tricarboxylate transporter receptor subunit TctC